MTRPLLILSLTLLTGCAGAGAAALGSATPPLGSTALTRSASAVASAADTPQGMPGETPEGLPGETPEGMPGAQFSCPGVPTAGTANCTIAVNLNVKPIANPTQPAALIPGLHPADLQSAYGLPSANAGATVAIVDAYDDPAAEADLAAYRSAFGLPACTSAGGCFRKINQRGGSTPPAPNAGWSQEIALDLDMVSAGCPRCSIVLVEADSASVDDLGAAVDAAAAAGASVVSNSYYAVEWSTEQREDAHYRHAGVAQTASSGDRGYQSYPAASAYVTAVGGTSLSASSGGWTASAWQYTGHGCSAYVARPAWQTGAGCGGARSAVDVAAVADPQTGVATFDAQAGGWYVAGGTSVGAPLVAAAYALSGHPAGPGYSYAHPAAFKAVGNPGYQPLTGLGTPFGVAGL
ncbi:MAG TPA: hypothetical protein VHT53_13695 [Candidatus Elarobacter sp.]|jgi:subtilase family serine protease|nr:hypothetical protein [Candidatus Elarobacter sp.]